VLGTASFAVILCRFNDIAIPDLPISFFGNIADAQGNWRWCNKCQGLAYAGISGGVCPA
jgi:hypothetical protein